MFRRATLSILGMSMLMPVLSHAEETPLPGLTLGFNTSGYALEDEYSINYEPMQLWEDFASRSDLVFLMRHGKTDWSVRDDKEVQPTDCANQRLLSDEGREEMFSFGVRLAENNLTPGEIISSEWCRNQETTSLVYAGLASVIESAEMPEITIDPELNLLLSLNGAADVVELRERVSNWTGEGASGPLLLVSHYTNIEELTDFRVFEGEILVIDPALENRVVGYIRLNTAVPDVGHFSNELAARNNVAQ